MLRDWAILSKDKELAGLKEIVDIISLQETHLRSKEEKYLSQVFWGNLYHVTATSKTNGRLIIGISKPILCTLKDIIKDKEGRYFILKILIYNWGITLVGVHAPNSNRSSFIF